MAIAHPNAETLRSVQIAHGGCLLMGLRTREFEMLRDCGVMRRRAAILDLGGSAKGYAVDCAVGVLQNIGFRRG